MGEQVSHNPEPANEEIPRLRSGFLEHTIAREFDLTTLGVDNIFERLETPEGRKEMLDRVRQSFAAYAQTVMNEVPPQLRPEHQLDNPLSEIRYRE
jgi:hypothetical protein